MVLDGFLNKNVPIVQTGKCKKAHVMVWKSDGQGREFFTCEKCGITPVKIKHIEKDEKND